MIDLSVVIPNFNEEANIKNAALSVDKALNGLGISYQMIIVDDGSSDKTGIVADRLAKNNKNIIVIHHRKNYGVGAAVARGIRQAKGEYITVFPGDNDMSWLSLRDLVIKKNLADLVICYPKNLRKRIFIRNLLSKIFVFIMNIIFGMKLKYFNGPFICKTKLLKNLSLACRGFLIYAELKIRLIRQGIKFVEIPFEHTGRIHGRSKAYSLTSLIDIIKTVFLLRFVW